MSESSRQPKDSADVMKRYVFIVLIGFLLIISVFSLTVWQGTVVNEYSSLINLSGRQRRFSQTVALQSIRYASETNPEVRRRLGQELSETLVLMRDQHELILRRSFNQPTIRLPRTLYGAYFSGEPGINTQFEAYVNAAESLLDKPSGLVTSSDPDLRYVVDSSASFLAELETAVAKFEGASRDFNRTVFLLEMAILVLGGGVMLFFWLGFVSPLFRLVKKSEGESQASLSRLNTVLSQLFASVFEADRDGKLLWVSESFYKRFMYSREQVIGKSFDSLFSLERSQEVTDLLDRAQDGDEVSGHRTEMLDADGGGHTVLINAVQAESFGGQGQLFGAVLDVTEDARREADLRSIKEKYNVVSEHSGLMIYDYDFASKKIAWSGSTYSITGYSIREFSSVDIDKWTEMIHPEDRDKAVTEIDRGNNTTGKYSASYRFRAKDGTYRHIFDQGTFIPVDKGENTRLVGVMIDVTRLRQTAVELEVAQQQFRQAFETSAIGFALVSLEGKWLKVNKALSDIVGYEEDELMKLTFQDITHPDDLETDLGYVQQVVRGEIRTYQMEKRYFHKDGHVVWILLTVSLVRDVDGKPLYFVSQIQDITQQKEASAYLSEVNELKNTFIRTVSHQFRTPLNSIRWNLELLLAGEFGKLNNEQEKTIKLSYEAEANIIRTLHDLLTVMDIEEGRVSVTKESVSFENLVSAVIDEFEKDIVLKKLDVRFSKPRTPVANVHVDLVKMKEVVAHLLRNAIWYTPERGSIEISLRKNKGNLRLSVTDTGVGIPKDEQKRIYERFYRASNASKMMADATGVGLTIAKHFVEQNGGKIGFSNTPHKGSTFWVEVPHNSRTEASS